MMRILRIGVIGAILFLSTKSNCQVFKELPVANNPGECYSSCYVPNEFQLVEKEFLIFIGEVNLNLLAYVDTVMINEDEVLSNYSGAFPQSEFRNIQF